MAVNPVLWERYYKEPGDLVEVGQVLDLDIPSSYETSWVRNLVNNYVDHARFETSPYHSPVHYPHWWKEESRRQYVGSPDVITDETEDAIIGAIAFMAQRVDDLRDGVSRHFNTDEMHKIIKEIEKYVDSSAKLARKGQLDYLSFQRRLKDLGRQLDRIAEGKANDLVVDFKQAMNRDKVNIRQTQEARAARRPKKIRAGKTHTAKAKSLPYNSGIKVMKRFGKAMFVLELGIRFHDWADAGFTKRALVKELSGFVGSKIGAIAIYKVCNIAYGVPSAGTSLLGCVVAAPIGAVAGDYLGEKYGPQLYDELEAYFSN